jgi:mRNA interferase MazF
MATKTAISLPDDLFRAVDARARALKPTYRHPALVLQRDEINASKVATVVVCVLTSNKALAAAPGNTLLPKRITRLPRDSVANASQIATVNKADLHKLVAMIPNHLLEKISTGVRWFLSLDE